jgi:hypothetical protein
MDIVGKAIFNQFRFMFNPNNKDRFIHISKSPFPFDKKKKRLPMLIKPNEPNPDGTNYLPYRTPEITHSSNTFDTVRNDSFKNKQAVAFGAYRRLEKGPKEEKHTL